jgi:nicotinamide riboside transporter PnuC
MTLLTITSWTAAFFGVLGTVLLALNGRRAGWGFVAYVVSNAGWLAFAWIQGNWPLLTQYVAFMASAILGIWLWLVRPRRLEHELDFDIARIRAELQALVADLPQKDRA